MRSCTQRSFRVESPKMKYLSITLLLSCLLAFPVGIGVYALAFGLYGGPCGEASEFSKYIAELLLFPLWPIGSIDNINLFCFIVGFPYAFIFVLMLFLLFRFTRKLRSAAHPAP